MSTRPDLDPRDLSVKGIGGFGGGLVLILVVSAVLMWWASVLLRGLEEAKDPPPPALAEARAPHTPPGPRLQADPEAELAELRAREDLILGSYAWVDKEAGIAQVPVGRAMELLVETATATADGEEAGP